MSSGPHMSHGKHPETQVAESLLCRPHDEVIDEAARIISDLTFTHQESSSSNSETVSVQILPIKSNEIDLFSVLITCFSSVNRSVDWTELPILIRPVDNALTEGRVIELDSRGQALVSDLTPGTYILDTSPDWGRSFELLPLGQDRPWKRIYSSRNKNLSLTLGKEASGRFFVEADTRLPNLATSKVEYYFIDRPTNRILQSGELNFHPAPDERCRWVGANYYSEVFWLSVVRSDRTSLSCCTPNRAPALDGLREHNDNENL